MRDFRDLFNEDDVCILCGRDLEGFNLNYVTSNIGKNICEDCVKKAYNVLVLNRTESYKKVFEDDLPKPKEIKEFLDKYVIGQDHAKKVLSVAVYNHYNRVFFGEKAKKKAAFKDLEIDKSNILLIGPTGSGKTLLARTLAKKLKVPFAIADATTVTEAGYVGDDVENILLKLIHAANDDVSLAEQGIIYIDEIDKIAKKGENLSITRDVSGEGVQQALLKIIEGTEATIPPQGGRKHPNQELIHMNTKNILFIFGGAFVGLDKIVEHRINVKPLGFGSEVKKKEEKDLVKLFDNLHPEDLIKYGVIPEFVGRIPITTTLNPLTEDDLVRIIKEPKNSIIKQFEWALSLEGVKLEFKDDAIRAIAQNAIKQKTGARGLRTIIENIMLEVMFDIPSREDVKKIIVDKDVILAKKPVTIVKKNIKKDEHKENKKVDADIEEKQKK